MHKNALSRLLAYTKKIWICFRRAILCTAWILEMAVLSGLSLKSHCPWGRQSGLQAPEWHLELRWAGQRQPWQCSCGWGGLWVCAGCAQGPGAERGLDLMVRAGKALRHSALIPGSGCWVCGGWVMDLAPSAILFLRLLLFSMTACYFPWYSDCCVKQWHSFTTFPKECSIFIQGFPKALAFLHHIHCMYFSSK